MSCSVRFPKATGHLKQLPLLLESGKLKLEVGAGAFFALSCSRVRRQKRARKREEKKARKKAKAPSVKEKSANRAFYATHSGNPVLEPKVTRQGGKARVLNKMYTSLY
jgi:hypothetical protein